jgi:hypothetical protein
MKTDLSGLTWNWKFGTEKCCRAELVPTVSKLASLKFTHQKTNLVPPNISPTLPVFRVFMKPTLCNWQGRGGGEGSDRKAGRILLKPPLAQAVADARVYLQQPERTASGGSSEVGQPECIG